MNIYKRPFDDQRQMRIRLETVAITMISALIESGSFSVRWSFVLDYENSRDPISERRDFAQYLARYCENTIEPDESIRRSRGAYLRRMRFEGGMPCIWLSPNCPNVITW